MAMLIAALVTVKGFGCLRQGGPHWGARIGRPTSIAENSSADVRQKLTQ